MILKKTNLYNYAISFVVLSDKKPTTTNPNSNESEKIDCYFIITQVQSHVTAEEK